MQKRMEPCAAQQCEPGDYSSWPLALICEGRNLISTLNLTPMLRTVMRFHKMGAGS